MLAIGLGKLLKEQEEQIKNRDESLEKAREEIKWLRGMLKEQETVKPIVMDHIVFGTNRKCSKCNQALFPAGKYCPHCGQVVKWDE